MIDVVRLDIRTFVLGEHKTIGLKNIRQQTDAPLSGVTGTIAIYDSAGTATLAATSMTMSGDGTPFMFASYLLTTGSGQTITAAGNYRAIYKLTYGSEIQIWEQVIQLLANPF
jgi:hypothetical protein